MITSIKIEPMQPDSLFAATVTKMFGAEVFAQSFEMFVTTSYAGQSTTVSYPLTPKTDSDILEKINFGLDFTQARMVEYLQRKNNKSK